MFPIANDAPFPRGAYYNPASTVNDPDLTYGHLIGRLFQFPDYNLNSSATFFANKPLRSGHSVTLMLCRNASGGTLAAAAKKIVKIDVDNPGSVTGFAAVGDSNTWNAVVDEYLPSTLTLPVGALFYCVQLGRGLCRSNSSVSSTSITAGMYCQPATGGYINGSGTIVTLSSGIVNSAALAYIRNCRIEGRTAYTGSAADADIDVYVHPN